MKFFFIVAIRNLSRHWRQSLAAILSVSAAFAALVIFNGYIEQTRQLFETQFRQRMMYGDVNIEQENLWTPEGRSEPWKFAINEIDQKFLKDYLTASSEVEGWTRFLHVNGMVNNGQGSTLFFGLGYDLENGYKIRQKDWYWNTLYGHPLEKAMTPSVVLGSGLGKAVGCEPTPDLKVTSTLHGYPPGERKFHCESETLQFLSSTPTGQVSVLDLPIAGLINAGVKDMDSKFLFMPLEQAQSLVHTTDVSSFSVLLKDSTKARSFSQNFNQIARKNGLSLHASDWREHKEIGAVYRKSMGFLNIFRNFFIVIVLTIAVLSVLNTLLKIVKERTREIGTWRSLGYTQKQLKIIFAFEAASLGLLGCFLGIIFSIGFSEVINLLEITYRAGLLAQPVPFAITIVPKDYLISVFMLTGLCIVAALWSIRSIFKDKICENLIYV